MHVRDRVELARRAAPVTATVAWVASAFAPVAGVHGTWLVPALALALATAAFAPPDELPAAVIPERPAPWTVASLSLALALVAALRATVRADEYDLAALVVGLLCFEAVVASLVAWLGWRLDGAVAPRLARSRGGMRHAALVAIALGALGAGAALWRFPGRAEPSLLRSRRTAGGDSRTLLGVFETLGGACPPRCDQRPRAAQRRGPDPSATEVTDDLAPGLSLSRRRTGPMTTRIQLTVTPPGHAPHLALDRTLYAGQRASFSRDPSGGLLIVTLAQHPTVFVRLPEGDLLSAKEGEALRDAGVHAPVAYVLTSLMGVALAAWFLRRARDARREADGAPSWRDATVEDDGMVHFATELPPAALPEGAAALTGPVVVTRVTTPAGAAYRSDGVVTIGGIVRGTRGEVLERLAARAAAWEHGAFACVLVTHAPLAGAWLLGETW